MQRVGSSWQARKEGEFKKVERRGMRGGDGKISTGKKKEIFGGNSKREENKEAVQ